MECLVLSARTFDFENKQGERIQGTKISYINKKSSNRDSEYGNPPFIVNTNYLLDENILSKFPAICNLDFEQVIGRNNKPELVLSDLNFVTELSIEDFF